MLTSANDPSAWQNFFVMLGGANAALTGLVFVALSIHLREVLEHPKLRPRAVIAIAVMTTQIVIAAIVLAPQPTQLMGAEILVVNLSFLATDVRQGLTLSIDQGRLLSLAIRVIYLWSALSLIAGVGGGFYVLAIAIVVTLARTMASAWALLTAIG